MTHSPASPEPPPSRHRGPLLGAAAAIGLILLVVVVVAVERDRDTPDSQPAPASTWTLHGTLSLTGPLFVTGGPDTAVPGAACVGSGGYDDIAGGAPVTITNAGRVLALGKLDSGVIQRATPLAFNEARGTCLFTFTVDNIPAGHDFYSVEVSHRGEVNYPASELEADHITITLG